MTTVFGLAALLVASRPGYLNLYFGECAVYLVIATYAALRFGRTRPWVAGACLAFVCLKPTFGVPLGVLLLARGAVSAVVLGGTLAFVTAVVVGMFVIRGAGGLAPFIDSLGENASAWGRLSEASGATGIYSIDTVALVDRLWNIPPAIEIILSVAILAIGGLAVACASRRDGASTRLAESVASLTILAFAHHQFYDGLLTALPITALASGRLPLPAGRTGQGLRWMLLALLTMAAFNYLSSYEALDGLGFVGATRLTIVSATGIAITFALLALATVAILERQLLRRSP